MKLCLLLLNALLLATCASFAGVLAEDAGGQAVPAAPQEEAPAARKEEAPVLPAEPAKAEPAAPEKKKDEKGGDGSAKPGGADVSTTGECAHDIEVLCPPSKVTPGEARVAGCLMRRVKAVKLGNASGHKVVSGCEEELMHFYADRAKDIVKDVKMSAACKNDVAKRCPGLPNESEPGAVLGCLKSKAKQLEPACKMLVVKAMIAAAQNYLNDAPLAVACKDPAERLCGDVEPGEGRVQDCLRSKIAQIGFDCQEELNRHDLESADDIRLSARLYRACRGDQLRFCKDVPYGSNRVKDCLEKHRHKKKFSSECKEEFEKMMEKRAADFRYDTALKSACEDDIKNVCGYQESKLDDAEPMEGDITLCLQDFKEELHSTACRAAVEKRIQRGSEDIRFDSSLSAACFEDRGKFCASHAPGSARVIGCLKDSWASLTEDCRARLFDREVLLAESIDFQYPLKKACTNELKKLCTKVQSGHARVIRCLHAHVDDSNMGPECQKEVRRNMNRMATDFRLNFRLKKACSTDIDSMCADSCINSKTPCGGSVLRCLQNKLPKIQSAECKEEVFYFVKMEVTDFRNDVLLAEACKMDVDQHCGDVEPGNGRVLDCLRMHRAELSPSCRHEEMSLASIQNQDLRLRPRLMKACSYELVLYCKEVKPGGGRMFNCLLDNVQKPDFTNSCRDMVVKREELAKGDYRLDAGVSGECEEDVNMLCAEEKKQLHGRAEVLRCLANKMMDRTVEVSDACEVQMSRAVRNAFWDFKTGAALTTACDEDVDSVCPKLRKKGAYSIGVIGRCLTKHVAAGKPMNAQCRKLVAVAAPKDAREYLQGTLNADGTLKSENSIMQVALENVGAATSVVTLTGWVAVASIMASVFVVVLGAVWLYRRYTGLDKPHLKSGFLSTG